MFEFPKSKRVRRNELSPRSQSSSPTPSSPDPELEAQLQARLAALYGPITLPTSNLPPRGSEKRPRTTHAPSKHNEEEPDSETDNDDGAQEFEFRLFATPSQDTALQSAPQKIILELEEDDPGEGGFVIPHRDRRYYFAGKAEGEAKRRLEEVALSGDDVLKLSARRAYGLEVPWRVNVLRIGGKALAMRNAKGRAADVDVDANADEAKKRTRPGKKSRIILRERKKKIDAKDEQKLREMESKGETEREKKTRMNREKKAKRRLREKAKKAGLSQVGHRSEDEGDLNSTGD